MCVDVCLYLYMHAGQCGERWQRKQIQAVAGLRVKLHGNTISSALTLLLSLCLSGLPSLSSLPSLSLSPSIPLFLLATACWLKKWAWPQINPSAYLSDPSSGTSPPAATNTHIGILLTAADKPTCNIKASWCNPLILLHVWRNAEWRQQINKKKYSISQ